jgi:hypothetical protein
VRPIGTNGLL